MRRIAKMSVPAALVAAAVANCTADPTEPSTPTEQVGAAKQHLTQCVTFQRDVNGTVADAMLSNPPQNQNYGSGPILRVGGKDETLLQFDLSSIPSFAIIDRATLKLYANGSAGDEAINIHRATNAWDESTVTFASFGQHYDLAVSGILLPQSPNAYKSADITSLVAAWVSGAQPNHGVLLETTGKKKTIFVSSDANSAAQRPALEVCYQTPDDHCSPNPCQNSGTCNNDWTGYTCTCPAGWAGTNCDISMHECSTNPCQNGGTCTNLPNDYQCACPTGYTGKSCETLIDNCAPNPCQNSGVCTNGVGTYTCDCAPGFTGTNCEINIDDCASAPCVHGTCTDGANSYSCSCEAGWTGQNCDVDIDDCVGNQCLNGSTCVDGLNSYTCACLPGFGGTYCQDNLNECATEPCLNGGTCTNGVNSYSCACAPGYTGTNCEIDIDECATQPCQNGALCVDGVASYSCQCPTGWMGVNCDVSTSSAPTVVSVVSGSSQDQVLTSSAIKVVVPAGTQIQMGGAPVTGSINLSAQLDGNPYQVFDVPTGEEEAPPNGEIMADSRHPIFPTYHFGPSGATFDPPLQATLVVPNEMSEPEVWLCDDNGINCQRRAGIFYEDTSVSPPQSKLYIEIDHFSTVLVTNKNPVGITFWGDDVMHETPNVYYIWYGNWSNNTGPTILTDFIQNLGGSPYMAINTGYSDYTGAVTGNLHYAGSVNYSGSLTTKSLTNANIQQIVTDSIGTGTGKLPLDANGIYFVLTAPDVSQTKGTTSFCTDYCGWHNHMTVSNQSIKYSFVGDASTQCPNGCMYQRTSPNGNAGADAMASVVAHEIVETLTDPTFWSWTDSSGNENGDKCNFNFGATSKLSNGAMYNITLGSRKYLIQQNWDSVKGACAMSAEVFPGSQTPDGTPCDDGNPCTQTDTYQDGVCVGHNPKSCAASDSCHLAGSCNPTTGQCSNPIKSNGATCDDGNASTPSDTCQSGVCVGGNSYKLLTGNPGANSAVSGCQSYTQATTTFTRANAGQALLLARNATGTQAPDFDELAVVTVTSPSNQVRKVNLVHWQPDCADSSAPTIPITGSGPALDLTSLLGSEVGKFTISIQARGFANPFSWSDTYLVFGTCAAGYGGADCSVALTSCAAVKTANPSAVDGTYTLVAAGHPVDLYCYNMAGTPAEYLTLAQTGPTFNFSRYAPDQTTSYTKVRFHPDTLTVDIADATFATNVGTDPQGLATISFGTASDCMGYNSQAGTANVNLVGTLFALAPNQFSTQGWYPAGSVTYGAQNKTANLTGGGYCGTTTTANYGATPLQLVYQPDCTVNTDCQSGVCSPSGMCSGIGSPAALSGLALWLRPDAGVAFGSGSAVSSWADQSGNGNNMTMATASRQPTWVRGGQNGLPVLQTSAAAYQTLSVSTAFNSAYSVFYVGRMNTAGGAHERLLNGVGNNWLLGFWNNAQDQAYFQGWVSPSGTPAATTNWMIYAVTGTGALSTVYRNNTQIFSSSAGVAAPSGLTLSCIQAGTSECSDGQIGEVLVYDRALSASEIKKVFAYLDTRWNVY